MAKKRNLDEYHRQLEARAGLTENDYDAYRQYRVSQMDGDQLRQNMESARDAVINGPKNKITTQHQALIDYRVAADKLNTFISFGGQVDGVDAGYFKSLQDQYNQSWNDLQRQIQNNRMSKQMGFGGLGMQTAAGIAPNGTQFDRDPLSQHLKPGRGLMNFDTMTPTEANQQAAQRNWYQQAITDAQNKQVQWGDQALQYGEDAQTAQDWTQIVQNLPTTNDARVNASNQEWMRQAAEANGIDQWADREDLLRQLQAKEDKAQRMGDTPMRLAQQGAAQERGYQAALYQMEHPEVSLDGAYYLSEAEKYEAQKRDRYLHGDLWNGTIALLREARARDSYGQIYYDENKREQLSQIMADPELGQAYQSAQQMTWDLRTVEYLDEYIKGALNTNGVLTADDIGQIRLVALQNNIDMPEDDGQIQQEVNRMLRQYSEQLEADMTILEAAGYDRAQLAEYMERSIDSAEMREYNEQNRAAAEENGFGMSVASTGANVVSGMGYISAIPQSIENIWATLSGNYDAYAPINTDSNWFRAGNFVKEVRDEVSQNLAAKYPNGTIMGENAASFLYGTGMSMLDNIVQMAMGAALFGGAGSLPGAISAGSPVTLGVMGLSAATNDLITLTDEGVPAGQAMLLSTLRGGLEILTEKIGIDALVSGMGRQQMGNLVKQIAASMLRQGAAEGAEEAIAEVGGDLADLLVRADESEMRRAIAEGMASGLTEKEALIRYVMDLGKRTAAAATGGFLSGLGFGGGAVATNLATDTNKARGETVLNNRTLPQLQQQAGFYGVDASGITEQSTARDIGRVHRQVEAAARGAEEELLQFARGKKYTQDGIQALQHAYAEYSNSGAGKMGPQEFAISFDTAYQHGKSDAKFGAGRSYLERAAKDGLTAGLTPGTIAYAYHSGVAAIKRTAKAKTKTVKQGVAEKKNAARAAQTAKTANVMQVEQIGEHDAVLVMPDGTRQNITAMDTRGTAAQIVAEAMDDGYGAVVVNQMLRGYDGDMDPADYYEQFRTAMLAGIEGESLSQAKKAATQLPAAVAKAAYDRGRLLGKAYDLADRIGSAGEQALDRYGYAAPAEFEKFYKAGLEGKSFRQAVKELGEVSEEIKDEMQAAVNAGLRDNKGGFKYGEQERGTRSNQESGRVRGMGTGESAGQAGSMAEAGSDGESQTDREATAGNESQADGTREEKISSKALGLQHGTDRATIKVIDPAQHTEEQRKIADQYAQQDISVTFVLGPIEIRQTDGSTKKARGVAVGQRNQIIVRADADLSVEQIAAHEAKHIEYARYPDRIAEDWKRFADVKNEEDLDRWIAGYAERYGYLEGYYDIDQFIEEALCDATADVSAPVVSEAYYQETFKPMAQKWRSEQATNLSEGAGYAKQADSGRVSYQLEPYTDKQIADWRLSKKIIIYKNDDQLMEFVESVLAGENLTKKMYFGKVAGDLAERIKRDTGLDLSNRNVTLKAENIRKILLYSHGNEQKEAARNQRAVKTEDFRKIVDIIGQPDEISRSNVDYKGRPVIRFEKTEDKTLYTIIAVDSGGSLDLYVQTMYIGIKNGSIFNVTNANALIITPETSVGTAPNISVREDAENVKADLYSIGGRNAATANLEALERAEPMEKAGGSVGEIYRETGWFRGADGQWRFEIDDSTMRYTPDRMAQRMARGEAYLDDIIDHPALFEAYPQLREVAVAFVPMRKGSKGVFRRAENKIYLADSLKNSPEDTLIHEIQHAIQALEGFAKGSSRAYWERILNEGGTIDSVRLRDATAALQRFEQDSANAEVIEARNRLNEVWDTEGARAGNALYAQYEADGMAAKVDAYEDLIWEQSSAGVAYQAALPFDLYKNTAGEQEARDTAARRSMTAEQRRKQMPQTGNKDTVFAEGSMVAMSKEEQTPAQELKAAQKRIKQLEGVNKKLEEQLKVTNGTIPDKKELRKTAQKFWKEYGGKWTLREMQVRLDAVWVQAKTEGPQAARQSARELASDLLRNYVDHHSQAAQDLKQIKKYLRDTRIYLSQDLRGDLDAIGGYRAVQKKYFGSLRLANSGTSVDQIYMELHEQWPAYFPEHIVNPADQLMHIIDVITDGNQLFGRNPMDYMHDEMQWLTTKILFDLSMVEPEETAMDRAVAPNAVFREKLINAAGSIEQEHMEQLTSYYEKKLEREQRRRERAVEKLQEGYKKKQENARERREISELRRKLLWHMNNLKRMGKKSGPEQQAEIDAMLDDWNLLTQSVLRTTSIGDYVQGMSTDSIPVIGYRNKENPHQILALSEVEKHPELKGSKVVQMEELAKWYENQKQNPDFIPDARIEKILQAYRATRNVADLSVADLQNLLDSVLFIENEIRTRNKLIDTEDRRQIYQMVQETINNVKSQKGTTSWLDQITAGQALSPVRMMHRITGYHDDDPMYQAMLALQQGEVNVLDYQRRAFAMFENFTSGKDGKAFMEYLAGQGKKQQPIVIEGMNDKGEVESFKITPDMRVAMYLHSQNYSNLRHIQRGGFVVPDYDLYVAGKIKEAYNKTTTVRLEPSAVRAITAQMTEREKAYAKQVAKYYNTMAKSEINAVSVKLKGYEIAKVEHYYPIEVDNHFVETDFAAIKYDGSVENMGFTHERMQDSKPILLGNASNTLARSVKLNSTYVGMAIPMRNFNKLLRVNVMATEPGGAYSYADETLSKEIESRWGPDILDKYFGQVMAELSGANKKTPNKVDAVWAKLRSNYAGAVLSMNAQTAAKQLLAYPSAGSILGYKALAHGLKVFDKVNVDVIKEYTPLLWHRMQGYIDADLGEYADRKKHIPKIMNWNQAVDVAVVKRLWAACHYKAAQDNKALVNNEAEWNRATAELFNKVMLESQANYAITGRGAMLRSDNELTKTFAMFKTEPFQQFNVLYDSIGNLRAKKQQLDSARQDLQKENTDENRMKVEAAEQSLRKAKTRLGQAVPAVLISQTLEVLITFAFQLWRGRRDEWEDEDGELKASYVATKLTMQLLTNMAGIVPFAGQVTQEIAALTTKALGNSTDWDIPVINSYGTTVPVLELIDNAWTDAKAIIQVLWSIPFDPKAEEGEELPPEIWRDKFVTLINAAAGLSGAFGAPAENMLKELYALSRNVLVWTLGREEGEYWYNQWHEASTASGHASDAADTLYALIEQGDMEAYRRVYDDVMTYKDADYVQDAMNRRIGADFKAGNIDEATARARMIEYGGKDDEAVNSWMRDYVHDMFKEGEISVEQAQTMLTDWTGEDDPDELYWITRGWEYSLETGEEFGRFEAVYDAVWDGQDITAASQELLEHGYREEQIENQIGSQIGAWYKGTSSDELTISKEEAIRMLQQYADKDAETAEEIVTEWKCYVDTGYSYDSLKRAYFDGEITEAQVAEWRAEYGPEDTEEAKATAAAYATLLEKGEHYIDDDAYNQGSLVHWARSYNTYGENMNFDTFVEYKVWLSETTADYDDAGDAIPYSKKNKVIAQIAAIPGLTPAQRDGLLLASNYDPSNSDTPW